MHPRATRVSAARLAGRILSTRARTFAPAILAHFGVVAPESMEAAAGVR